MTSFAAFYASPLGHFFRDLVLSHLPNIKPEHNVLGVGPVVSIVDKLACAEQAVLVPEAFWEPVARDYPVTSFNDKSALPLKKNDFDSIVMAHTLEQTTYPASFLREIWRALKPGGTLFLFLPNQEHPFDHTFDLPSSKIYTASELNHFLDESFFKVLVQRPCLFPPPQWIGRMPQVCKVLEKCLSALPVSYGSRMTLVRARKDVSLSATESAPLTWQRA